MPWAVESRFPHLYRQKKMLVRALNVLLLVGSILATWFCCSRGHHQSVTSYFSISWCSWNNSLSYQACCKCSMLPHKTPYQHSNPKSSPLKLLSNLKWQLQHLQNPNPHHPSLSLKYCSTGKSQPKGSGCLYKKNGCQNMNTLCLGVRGGRIKQKPLRQTWAQPLQSSSWD